MKRITKQKIYRGKVELRDYEVTKLLKFNEPVRVVVGTEYMILTPKQLRAGVPTNTFQSIHKAQQVYTLIGYDWKPEKNNLPLFSETPPTKEEYFDRNEKLLLALQKVMGR